MKKVFTLLTLLLCVCSGAWGQDLSLNTSSAASAEWTGNYVDDRITLAFEGTGANTSYSSGGYNIGNNPSGYTTNYFEVEATSAIEKVSFLIAGNSGTATSVQPVVWAWASTLEDTPASFVIDAKSLTAGYNQASWMTYDVSSSDYKKLRIFRKANNVGNGKSIVIWGIKVWLKALTPTITTQPVGASYVTGDPISALTISATASKGDLSYQWYACDDAVKTNAAAIDGATSASYTPTGAGFYFCTVTDSNGSVDSNVVEVSVSSAAAPTINVTGAPGSAVAVGTSVTLAAVVSGNPEPTIQWYSNTSASTEGATTLTGETTDTYSPSTAVAGTTYYYAVATNSVGSTTSSFQTVTVQEKLAAPTINVANTAFVSSIDIPITDNSGKTATIKYSTNDGSTWSDYSTAVTISAEGTTTIIAKVVKDGFIESDEVTAKFKKVTALSTPATVSTATTWDWSKPSTTLQLTGTTIPNTSTTNVCASDFNGTIYDAITWEDFDPSALVMSNFQYPVNASNDCFQGTYLKFNTSVSGTITVTFSNTGGGTRPDRYLYVNGAATSYKSKNTDKVVTDPIYVNAGEVELKGVIEGTGDNYLRIYKIVFTPAEAVGTIAGRNYGSYVTTQKLDFASAEGITAYIATGFNGAKNAIVLKSVDVVPAGTPIIVNTTTQGATVNVPVTTADASSIEGNALVAGDGTTAWNGTDGYTYFYLASDQFHKATSGTLQSGKAYLKIANGDVPAAARDFGFVFEDGETTGVGAIENAQLTIGNSVYDLQGRRVAQPTRGLYIVNGKKVVIR